MVLQDLSRYIFTNYKISYNIWTFRDCIILDANSDCQEHLESKVVHDKYSCSIKKNITKSLFITYEYIFVWK